MAIARFCLMDNVLGNTYKKSLYESAMPESQWEQMLEEEH